MGMGAPAEAAGKLTPSRTDKTKSRKHAQRFPFLSVFEAGPALGIEAAFGNPLADLVGSDRPVFLLVGPDYFIHHAIFRFGMGALRLQMRPSRKSYYTGRPVSPKGSLTVYFLKQCHQVKWDLTSGLFMTTNAQMPKGSPSRQQQLTVTGSMATMHATMASERLSNRIILMAPKSTRPSIAAKKRLMIPPMEPCIAWTKDCHCGGILDGMVCIPAPEKVAHSAKKREHSAQRAGNNQTNSGTLYGLERGFARTAAGKGRDCRCGRGGDARLERVGKFREGRERLPIAAALEPSLGVGVYTAIANPLAYLVAGNGAVFLLVCSDDFIHRRFVFEL